MIQTTSPGVLTSRSATRKQRLPRSGGRARRPTGMALPRVALAVLVCLVACGNDEAPNLGTASSAVAPACAGLGSGLGYDPFERLDDRAGSLDGRGRVSQRGTFGYTIPIFTPPARANHVPHVALSYDSQGGDGVAGVGWSISGLSAVARCRKNLARDEEVDGIRFDDDRDNFCLDGVKLVQITTGGDLPDDFTPPATGSSTAWREYRPENDPRTRVLAMGTGGVDSWVVMRPSGLIDYFGDTPASQGSADTEHTSTTEVLTWHLRRTLDRSKNAIDYHYFTPATLASAARRVTKIEYGHAVTGAYIGAAKRSIEFEYVSRPYRKSAYVSALPIRDVALLSEIRVKAPLEPGQAPVLARVYKLSHNQSTRSARMLLTKVEECGPYGQCLPPTILTYEQPSGAPFAYQGVLTATVDGSAVSLKPIADYDGDGYDDLLLRNEGEDPTDEVGGIRALRSIPDAAGNLSFADTGQFLASFTYDRQELGITDWNGDGAFEVATWSAQEQLELRGLGDPTVPGWVFVSGFPAIDCGISSWFNCRFQFLDFSGNGVPDVLIPHGDHLAQPNLEDSRFTWHYHRNEAYLQQNPLPAIHLSPSPFIGQNVAAAFDWDGNGTHDLVAPGPAVFDRTGLIHGNVGPPAPLPTGGHIVFADVNGDGLKDRVFLHYDHVAETEWSQVYLTTGGGLT
jgi:hypothetical protein